jgi:hypothetical protein
LPAAVLAGVSMEKSMATKPKMTEKQDDRMDRKAGIKENSPRDVALDKSRGLPPEKPKAKGR